MKKLEIIHLRSSVKSFESLRSRIAESIRAEGDPGEVVLMFRRCGLESDVAIHIHHHDDSGYDGPSVLGLHLAAGLKAHGLVEHTLWEALS